MTSMKHAHSLPVSKFWLQTVECSVGDQFSHIMAAIHVSLFASRKQ